MLSSHVICMLRGSPGILHGHSLSHYRECRLFTIFTHLFTTFPHGYLVKLLLKFIGVYRSSYFSNNNPVTEGQVFVTSCPALAA